MQHKTIQPKLSPDAHWLFVTALNGQQVLRNTSFYLHSIDDILKDNFILTNGTDVASNVELGMDKHVVKELKNKGIAERIWLGQPIWFKYKVVPLKHADMMRKRVD